MARARAYYSNTESHARAGQGRAGEGEDKTILVKINKAEDGSS